MQLWRGRWFLLWGKGGEVLLLRGEVMEKKRILFICTANAARSQMAEGLLRAKYGERYEVFSAGTRQSKVSTRAIAVMQEIGIDISHHRSKTLAEFEGATFNLAITLCDNAHAVCPIVAGAKKTIHKGFADPHLTPGTEKEVLDGYRKVRDEIAAWIEITF
jgi:arsenate reductase